MPLLDSRGLMKYALVQRLTAALSVFIPAVQVTTDYPDEGLLLSIGDDATPDGPRVVVGLGQSSVPRQTAGTAQSTARVYYGTPDPVTGIALATFETERRTVHVLITIVAGGSRGKSVADALEAAVEDALRDPANPYGTTSAVALPDRLPTGPGDTPPLTLGLQASQLTFVTSTPDDKLALRHVYRRDVAYSVLLSQYTQQNAGPIVKNVIRTINAGVGVLVPFPIP